MGWTVAEGSRFSGSTPPTPATTRHPAPQAWLPQLACGAFFGAGGASNRPARRHAATAGGNSGACSAPYGFQFIEGRREWHQGEQETLAAIIEHRRAGLSWAKVAGKLSATGHRTRNRRPVDAAGCPPGPPGARTRPRRRGVDLVLLPCRPSVLDMEAAADTAARVPGRHGGGGACLA